MTYYDIHTHHKSQQSDIVSIVNCIIGRESIAKFSALPFLSAGIHPWFITDSANQLEELKHCIENKAVVAIGEAGLDKLTQTPFSLQLAVFEQQIRYSESTGKPLIIHCVKAWGELLALHKRFKPVSAWIIHGFRGNAMLACQLIQQGFWLSFGLHFQSEALRVAWPDRLLVETDDAEVEIPIIYKNLVESLSVSESEFSEVISRNFQQLFSL